MAAVIAIGGVEEGEFHLLGFDLGGSEDEALWLAYKSFPEEHWQRIHYSV